MTEAQERGRILIIEDEELIRELMVTVLEKDGYDVCWCRSAGEGLQKLDEHFYNVIMVDLELSDERGMDLIETMHGMRPDSCVVAITSYPSIGAAVEALKKGAYDYISKPFAIETLRKMVTRAFERQGMMEAAKERDHLRRLSTVDELTGLYNYRYFMEHLELEIGRAHRYSYPVSLMMIDLDDFKVYNDANGHIQGNELLKGIARLFRDSTRESDTVARYGGEEFAAILPHTDVAGAVGIAGRLRETVLGGKFEKDDVLPRGKLTVSIGIASYPDHAGTSRELAELADRTLYRAKYEGKDRVCVCGAPKEGLAPGGAQNGD